MQERLQVRIRRPYCAPIAGLIASRDVSPGQFLTQGSDKPVMTITDPTHVWLIAQLAESETNAMHLGDTVTVATPAPPGRSFPQRSIWLALGLIGKRTAFRCAQRSPMQTTDSNPNCPQAILILVLQGESANLLSVGTLDFGLVVDASVIMVENIYRHMVERSAHVERRLGHFTPASRLSTVLGASHEVSRGIFFAAAIIIASFLPLFTLTGVEGHIFGPTAKTYAYAITGGLIATFTVAPVLAAILLPDRLSEVETRIVALLRGVYEPAASFALANRILSLDGAGRGCWQSQRLSAFARLVSNSCRIWRKATCACQHSCASEPLSDSACSGTPVTPARSMSASYDRPAAKRSRHSCRTAPRGTRRHPLIAQVKRLRRCDG